MMKFARRAMKFVVVVTLAGIVGAPSALASATSAVLSGRSHVAEPWGGNLMRPSLARSPEEAPLGFPQPFDQPAMGAGPGSCGATAAANLSLLLASTGFTQPWTYVSPWKVLDAAGYSRIWGVRPSVLANYLNRMFASLAVPPRLQGTKFQWQGAWKFTDLFKEAPQAAQIRLEGALRAGKPVLAVVNWDNRLAHFVVVSGEAAELDAYWVVTWGQYALIPKAQFIEWWANHPYYRYGSIVPSRPSLMQAFTQH